MRGRWQAHTPSTPSSPNKKNHISCTVYQGIKQGDMNWQRVGEGHIMSSRDSSVFGQLVYVISWVLTQELVNVDGGQFSTSIHILVLKTGFRNWFFDRIRKIILTRLSFITDNKADLSDSCFFLHCFHLWHRALGLQLLDTCSLHVVALCPLEERLPPESLEALP